MLKPIPSNDGILDAMRKYCDRHNISMSDLSEKAGNRALATRFKAGRSVTIDTYNRLVDVMQRRGK